MIEHTMLPFELEMFYMEMERMYEDPSWEFENVNTELRVLVTVQTNDEVDFEDDNQPTEQEEWYDFDPDC